MAKKLLNPLEDPPTASSSDDEEMQTSAGEKEEEEEDSASQQQESKDPVKSAAKPGSDLASGSEKETDSDSEIERRTSPGSGKTKPRTKQTVVKSGTKRPSEGTPRDTNAKLVKKMSSGDDDIKIGEDSKKPSYQRLWSEKDEITLLQGMINFKTDTGKSPFESSQIFYEIIKESISFEFTKNQFMDKIRSLKKKYITKEKTGVKPSFSRAHEQKCYELAKSIWGPEGIALESASKRSQSPKLKNIDSVPQHIPFVEDDRKPDLLESPFLVESIASFGVDEKYVKQRLSLVSVETKKEIEEKLKALQAKEVKFALEKIEFVHMVTSMINDVSKN